MQPDTVARVAALPTVAGIKEACGDAERVGAIREAVGDDGFVLLSGEDAQTFRMMELGAVGTISVTANVLPREMAEFCNAFLEGDTERARELDARLQPVHDILFVETSPAPAKWALHLMGKVDAGIRLPLVPLSAEHEDELRARLAPFGAL